MRIIGGRFKGTQLKAPGAAGGGAAHLRPSSDRTREALFNLLAHGGEDLPGGETPPRGARVLDLFAGTGALGLEALSRGAAKVCFVDDHAPSRGLIRDNAERLGVTGEVKIWRRDATKLGPNRGGTFDLVFLDPPYGKGLGERALAAAFEGGWIAPGALIVWEERTGVPVTPPAGCTPLDERSYGEATVRILRAPGSVEEA
ncbi:16S rRNA (guanine(966)-N(2))-methyltransferase RsmD [Rhodovulum sp. DZ06]|uniref:16S rRNA (guanine(966)-N(2))-methyltransferase RsmD n=1 Tax=Rhodovulum sp. DZ06 TaxID=3425126 RepID=UPI003D350BDD